VESDHEERRLTTILSADVVAYSQLMAADEAGTLAQLKAHRKELINPKATQYHGRVVKLIGDGTLMEFGSVVDAVKFAVDVQRAMKKRNSDVPKDQRIVYRIGINIGDVLVEGDDFYGDGVNVAARLEALAEPGGICVSRSVHTQVLGKAEIGFEDLGMQEVEKVPSPVQVYRVRLSSGDAAESEGVEPRPTSRTVPEKPSIAVLPFVNMSADPEQEYFSDGITEDIITELSKFRSLFVIARNSSFSFKGQQLEVKEISRRLGVRYVVEGSVRRTGKRLRISAQLIDAVYDAHIWAERYDRGLEDIFAVQDEVTGAIVTAIEPELASAERNRARRKVPESLDAWECYQRGLWHLYRYRAEDSIKAQEFFRRAIEVDPNFGPAHAALAYAVYYEVIEGLVSAPDDWISRALEAARTAVILDERDSFGHMVLGRVLLAHGELDASTAACEMALELNPNDANAHYGVGLALCFAGRPEAAMPKVDEALRLNPHDPGAWAFLWLRSHALTMLRSYDEALVWARKAVRQPNATLWAFAGEAVALAHLGRIDEARTALDRALTVKPDLSADFFESVLPWKDPAHLEHYIDGLRRAGLTA
jgi:adenylate cyclase